MGQPQAKAKRPGPRRLRTIQPAPKAPAWNGEAEALEKVGGELGLALWKALRRVRLWTETAPERRKDMFPPPNAEIRGLMAAAGMQAPELIEAIGVFTALLRAPERAEGKRLAEACNQVYQWADAQGLSRVAMYFAEAAATVEPSNPTWAIDAGWMCRRIAVDDLMERSAAWYDRAFGLAVRANDKQEVIRSLTEYGALMKDIGRNEKARVLYERAARRAARTGRLRQAAVAQHYLLGLVAETGNYLQGERYARQALQNYPIHDPQLPALAHDWAFLLVRLNLYPAAISLLEAIVLRIQAPEEQAIVWSTLGWAAAGVGRHDRFDEAERKVLQLVGQHEEYAPAALLHLAEGARLFKDWERAHKLAKRAVHAASARKESILEKEALEFLEKISDRISAGTEIDSLIRDRVDTLNRRFKTRLRNWKAPGKRQPGASLTANRESSAGGAI